jgi:hypothetical protein
LTRNTAFNFLIFHYLKINNYQHVIFLMTQANAMQIQLTNVAQATQTHEETQYQATQTIWANQYHATQTRFDTQYQPTHTQLEIQTKALQAQEHGHHVQHSLYP